jgi:hypothetical protein
MYVVHPSVGLRPPTASPLYYSSISYIQLLLCTKPQSRASHQTGDLCTEHQILLPKLGQGTEPTLYQAQSLNTHTFPCTKPFELLALSSKRLLLLPYILLLFILLQTLTIGPNMGKPHGPTSHNPLQKP